MKRGMLLSTAVLGSLAAGGLLVTPKLGHADSAAVIEKAKQELASEAARFNPEGRFKFAIEIDWSSIPDLEKDPSSASAWAQRCGGFMQKMRTLCESRATHKISEPCVDHVNQSIKTLRCVAVADSDNERVELKGPILTYSMAEGMSSNAKEKVEKTLRTMLPQLGGVNLQHDVDAYFAKQDEYKAAPLTVDVASFKAGGFDGLSGIATYCAPAWKFLEMVNNPECQLKSCKGDGAKKQAFVKGAKQLRCVHSKEEKAPEKKGDTIHFYSGEWASKSGSLDGIPFAAFNALRRALKIRDCGVDDRSMDPSGGGGVMTSAARKECCAKAGGKCMPVSFDGSEEVCSVVGFTAEKKCHQRDRLKKAILDKGR